MAKKVATVDRVIKLDDIWDFELGVAKTLTLVSGKCNCINVWQNKITITNVNTSQDGKDLILETEYNGEEMGNIVLQNYMVQNGKNSYKYVKDELFHEGAERGLFAELNSFDDGYGILNPHLIDEFYASEGKVSGTAFSDMVDVSKWETNVPESQKGLAINTFAGDDLVRGTFLNDTVVLGTGENALMVDASKSFGDDTVYLTSTEKFTLGLQNDIEGQVTSIQKVGNDVKVTLSGQKEVETYLGNAEAHYADKEPNDPVLYATLTKNREVGITTEGYTQDENGNFVYTEGAAENLYKASLEVFAGEISVQDDGYIANGDSFQKVEGRNDLYVAYVQNDNDHEKNINEAGYANGANSAIVNVAAANNLYKVSLGDEVTITTAGWAAEENAINVVDAAEADEYYTRVQGADQLAINVAGGAIDDEGAITEFAAIDNAWTLTATEVNSETAGYSLDEDTYTHGAEGVALYTQANSSGDENKYDGLISEAITAGTTLYLADSEEGITGDDLLQYKRFTLSAQTDVHEQTVEQINGALVYSKTGDDYTLLEDQPEARYTITTTAYAGKASEADFLYDSADATEAISAEDKAALQRYAVVGGEDAYAGKISALETEGANLYTKDDDNNFALAQTPSKRYSVNCAAEAYDGTVGGLNGAKLYTVAEGVYTYFAPAARYSLTGGNEAYTGTVNALNNAKLYTKDNETGNFTLAETPEARYAVNAEIYGDDEDETASAAENLTLYKEDDNHHYVLNEDPINKVYETELTRETQGTITFKNLAVQDVVGAKGLVEITSESGFNAVDDVREYQFTTTLNNAATTFTGTYLNTKVNVEEGTSKNLTITAGKGDLEADLTNASAVNTVVGNTGNDVVHTGKGNDILKLSGGINEINYDLSSGETIGKDVYTPTLGEDLVINMKEYTEGQVMKKIVGNDLVITAYKAEGATHFYTYEKTETTADVETVKYQKTETKYDQGKVCYEKVVTTDNHDGSYTIRTYEYTEDSGAYSWILDHDNTAQAGLDGDIKYYRVIKSTADVTVDFERTELQAFNAEAAREDLGAITYLYTQTRYTYGNEGWTDAQQLIDPIFVAHTDDDAGVVCKKITTYENNATLNNEVEVTEAQAKATVVADKFVVVKSQWNENQGAYNIPIGNPEVTVEGVAGVVYTQVQRIDSTEGEISSTIVWNEDAEKVFGPQEDYELLLDNRGKPIEAGTLTIKNYLNQKIANTITLVTDPVEDPEGEELMSAYRRVELSNANTSFAGTYLNDFVTASEGTNKNLKVTVGTGDNVIDLTKSSGINTITAGKGNDVAIGGTGNDTFNLGAGENTYAFDTAGNRKFGNDVVNLTANSKLTLGIYNSDDVANGFGLAEGQLTYKKSGNDIIATVYGSTASEDYYEYEKETVEEKATTTTGYKYETTYEDNGVVSYKKTVTLENNVAVPGGQEHAGEYLKTVEVYDYTENEGVYSWVKNDAESEAASGGYVANPIDREEKYERIVTGGAHPTTAEIVWNNDNLPLDMGAGYTATTNKYAWVAAVGEEGQPGYVAAHWSNVATGDAQVIDIAGDMPTTPLYQYTLETNSAVCEYQNTVVVANENAAKYADQEGVIYQNTTSAWVADEDSNWSWVDDAPTYLTEGEAGTTYTLTSQSSGGQILLTDEDEDLATYVDNDGKAIHYSQDTKLIGEYTTTDEVLGTITLKNLAANNKLATIIDPDGNNIFDADNAYDRSIYTTAINGGKITGTIGNDIITAGQEDKYAASATINSLEGNDRIIAYSNKNIFNHTADSDFIASYGTADTVNLVGKNNKINDNSVFSALNVANNNLPVLFIDINGDGKNTVVYSNFSDAENSTLTVSNNGVLYKTEYLEESTPDDGNTSVGNTISIMKADNILPVVNPLNPINERINYSDTAANNIVVGNRTGSFYTYEKGGLDNYQGGTGMDGYDVQVSNFAKSTNRLVINDKGGLDVLLLDNMTTSTAGFYFDVDWEGNIFNEVEGGSANLSICDKTYVKSLGTSHVTVANYAGDGQIEAIMLSDNEFVDMEATISNIKENVSEWLWDHGFDSTIDVMENGNRFDKASLLACFNQESNVVIDENGLAI